MVGLRPPPARQAQHERVLERGCGASEHLLTPHPGRSLRPCFTANARNAAIAGKTTRSARATTNHCRISGVPTTSSTASLGLYGVFVAQTVALADILLMFLYTEAIGMIVVFYTGRGAPFRIVIPSCVDPDP